MRRWLPVATLGGLTAAGLALWWAEPAAPGLLPLPGPVSARAEASPAPARLGVQAPPAATPLEPMAARAEPAEVIAEAPGLDPQEARMLMQVMLERGDPRSPALGGLKPRPTAAPAVLADPAQYQAFEDRHSRAQIQAYAGGVQQIPEIRARIEQAAQSGERSAAELDEARAALEQLEMLQRKLQREAPELLSPGS